MAKILIVDDQASILEILTRQLEARGHQVVSTTRGAAAIDFVRRRSFDVVITDLRIDEIDGLRILSAVT